MEKRIDLFLDAPRDGAENMARDRELLAEAERGRSAARVYTWEHPTVSLGRRMRAEEIATIFPELPVVSRPSGGGAVLHGFDVTVAWAAPLTLLEVRPRALRETYRRLVAPLAEALTACGLPCGLAEESATGPTLDCFAGGGRMDLLHAGTGKKVAGCALVATRDAALLQASVPARPIPSTLPIDAETAARYTNPEWRFDAFPDAWVDALARRGFEAATP